MKGACTDVCDKYAYLSYTDTPRVTSVKYAPYFLYSAVCGMWELQALVNVCYRRALESIAVVACEKASRTLAHGPFDAGH